MKKATKKQAPPVKKPNSTAKRGVQRLAVPAAPAAAASARSATLATSAALPIASQLRIPLTFDPLGQSGSTLPDLSQTRMAAVSNLFTGIQQVHGSLSALLTAMTDPPPPLR